MNKYAGMFILHHCQYSSFSSYFSELYMAKNKPTVNRARGIRKQQHVESLDQYALAVPLPQAINYLENLQKKYSTTYENLYLDISVEAYYDDCSVSIDLLGDRPETDEEMKNRIKTEERVEKMWMENQNKKQVAQQKRKDAEAKKIKQQKEERKKLYEELKKEFGS